MCCPKPFLFRKKLFPFLLNPIGFSTRWHSLVKDSKFFFGDSLHGQSFENRICPRPHCHQRLAKSSCGFRNRFTVHVAELKLGIKTYLQPPSPAIAFSFCWQPYFSVPVMSSVRL